MFQTDRLAEGKSGMITLIQKSILVVLRIAIGWHFLYEGIAKLYNPDWTSSGYLEISRWLFSDVFHWITANPIVLRTVDMLNIWGLVFIGLGLMLGCFTRIAGFSGIILLLLYYIANPPFVGFDFGVITEGNYLMVDKNFVELCALFVITLFPTGTYAGLDGLIARRRAGKISSAGDGKETEAQEQQHTETSPSTKRREMLKNLASLPFLGAFVLTVLKKRRWESNEEKNLADAITSATIKTFNFASLKDLKGTIPHGEIGGVKFSKVILGGNLIGGWAHARDLIYVSKLVKSYHHRDKVFETFLLAEKCGINTILTNPMLCGVIKEYWKRNIGSIQFISDCGGEDLLERVQMSIDNGACSCYVQGETADRLVRDGNIELIGKAVDLIRKNNMPAGIGGHYLETIKGCVDYGLSPDYWMKTFHHTNYWSANSEKEHDNIYCRKPQETIEFMKDQPQPWIAFKTLAAGALKPEDGFRYAFENGADFICVGMYDFQLVDDTNIALGVLNGKLRRQRPWIA
ncbi:DoxX family protein [Candidatus Latescibacterota bacterium]